MAQPRSQHRIRDFLTGRDQAKKNMLEPFLKLDRDDREGLKRVCADLSREYHLQCRLYKKSIVEMVGMNMLSDLKPFTKAVVDYVSSLKSGKMDTVQAKVILTSARFLRQCVAGRAVFTEKCVEARDIEHLVAENLFGRALIALNNKRAEAIAVASKPQVSKKKKKKGTKSNKNKSNKSDKVNLYKILEDSLDDIEKSLEEPLVLHEEKVDEEVDVDEEEKMDEETFFTMFMENEVRDMKDMVHSVMQADYLYSIEDSIWGGADESREFVYLKVFEPFPLSLKSIYAFIQKFTKNRYLLFILGQVFQEGVRWGCFSQDTLQFYFDDVLEFLRTLTDKQLRLVYLCARGLFNFISVTKSNGDSDVVATSLENWSRKMKYLRLMGKIDPLCLSYFGLFKELNSYLIDYHSVKPLSAEVKCFANMATNFKSINPRVSIEEIIVEGKKMDCVEFSKSVFRDRDRVIVGGYSETSYEPTYVVFFDDRSSLVEPMSLPVEMKDDDDHVDIKIHDEEVDEYVRNLVAHNGWKCEVYDPFSHVAYMNRENIVSWAPPKRVQRLVYADGTEMIFS